MYNKAGVPIETLPALLTLVRLLPRVDSLMVQKVGALRERFAAFAAFVRFLPRMVP